MDQLHFNSPLVFCCPFYFYDPSQLQDESKYLNLKLSNSSLLLEQYRTNMAVDPEQRL